jgi:hypothetical protein
MARACLQGLGGEGRELFPQDLYSEKIGTCLCLTHMETQIIYKRN